MQRLKGIWVDGDKVDQRIRRKLSEDIEVLVYDGGDDRVTAGDCVITEEYHGQAASRYLDAAGDDAFAGQLDAGGAFYRYSIEA